VENTRLREAMRQTEEALKADLSKMSEKQLQAQQMQLKEYMDTQTQAMAQAAFSKVPAIVTLHSKYARALIFQNFGHSVGGE